MGRGIKAGRAKKTAGNFALMEDMYRKGMIQGYRKGKDDYLELSNLLFQVAMTKEFGWSRQEFETMKACIGKITSDANERDVNVVVLIKELKESLESEDFDMAAKEKYSEADLIKGIEDGLDNEQIMERLSVAYGSRSRVRKRLDNLRQKHGALEINMKEPKELKEPLELPETEFDLKLYDTLTRSGNWYRVTAIGKEFFTATETRGAKDTVQVSKADYISGKSGFIKRDLPPVTSYVDETLKKKPAVPNPDFEAAVEDMIHGKMDKDRVVSQLENLKENSADFARAEDGGSIWHDDIKALEVAIDAVEAQTDVVENQDDIDPAYSFDVPVKISGTDSGITEFCRRAELSFKADMERYANNVSKIKEKMNTGKIIDLADVIEYNRIADKYRGEGYGREVKF